MSDDFTLEKLGILSKLNDIAQNQAVMREQLINSIHVHEAIQKILDRHDEMLLGDGSIDHMGMNARIKTLEDDMNSRSVHHRWIWSAIIASFLEHLRHMFFSGK